MLRHVDLCSGIGGFSLGFEWAQLSTPILFCDTEPWCRKILAKNFPNVPIATDVKELANDPERLVPDCDILTAGYPCQPFSVAGKQKGTEDDRHIWPYIFRIVTQKRPTWCVFENVYGHIAMGLDQVLADLESEGYATRTFVVPACGVNAPHKRDRLWIVGYAEHDGSSTSKIRGSNAQDARGASQGQIQTKQSSGASGREDDVTLADTNSDDGRNGSSTKSQGRQSRMEHRSGSQRQLSKNPIRMWPTPLSSDYKNMDTANQMSLSTSVRMWPTPVARDHKGGYQGGRVRNGKVSWDSLDVAVQHTDNQEKTGGQLNPMFVEWLMGYPKGWTE